VRKAERAWFLSGGEKSEALIRVAFDSLGQKQRVFDPYCLSLSSMVAAATSQNLCFECRVSLSRIWKSSISKDAILKFFDYFCFILLTFWVVLITI
jgi:uncharacterized BrkB/YihY/UPF0761 family membrane protein